MLVAKRHKSERITGEALSEKTKHTSVSPQPSKINPIWHTLATGITSSNRAPWLQAKLTVGAPNDKYEQEADRVADQVMRMPEPREGEEPGIQRKIAPLMLQRVCVGYEEEMQRQPVDEEESRVSSVKSPSKKVANSLWHRLASKNNDYSGFQPQPTKPQKAMGTFLGAGRLASKDGLGFDIPKDKLTETGKKFAKSWYMLKPPPAIQQPGLTCWAASLSAWLKVRGMADKSVIDILFSYDNRDTCIDHDDNSLPYSTTQEVYAEWGVDISLAGSDTRSSIDYDDVKSLLQKHGHFLLATGGTTGHVIVVYGVGIDDERKPNKNYMSVMDPIDGNYQNIAMNSISSPMAIGIASGRTGKGGFPIKTAPCRP